MGLPLLNQLSVGMSGLVRRRRYKLTGEYPLRQFFRFPLIHTDFSTHPESLSSANFVPGFENELVFITTFYTQILAYPEFF